MEHLVETTSGAPAPGGKRKGSRVRVPLPGDNATILPAAEATAIALKGKFAFFRRGEAVVFPSPTEPKMLPMTPTIFRTEIERHVSYFKERYNEALDRMEQVDRSLNSTDAQSILEAPAFWSTLPEIKRVHPCPLPCLRADGTVTLLKQGYDAESGIYTF